MHRRLLIMTRVCAIAVLAAPAPALAAAAEHPDAAFYEQAAEGGIAEVEAGKLAQDKGHSEAVKEFGAMMVKDHTAANVKLKSIAGAQSVSLPASASAAQVAAQTKLQVLAGGRFDKAYIRQQISAHQRTVVLFKKEIALGRDSQAKSFASETLPTVQAHLKKIRSVAAAAGVIGK